MIPDKLKSALRDTLLTGGYNLLLGSGVTLDSCNSRGDKLPSSEQLRLDVCTATGAPDTTSLTRAYTLLNDKQRDEVLTQRFLGCKPGVSVRHVPRFLWRRMFTFNIDDVLENLYESNVEAKQKLVPLNFDAPFEPTPIRSELLAVHLHGWVRQPRAGYVFSPSEYVRVMNSLNPWMHLLSEILATETFIIAGTSLNEVDLEYYLSHRTSATPRRGRGPSLLIEPNPDAVTSVDCERYGLELVHATFGEFMDWLHSEFPSPPHVADLIVPDTSTMFSDQPSPQELVAFFSDFELVQAADLPLPGVPSRFLYGREPEWRDLHQHLDIERQDNSLLLEELKPRLASDSGGEQDVVLILDQAGSGKTTVAKRVAHDLALSGVVVLNTCTTSRIDTQTAAECLKRMSTKVLLVVDGLADHAEQVAELLEDTAIASSVVVLASERVYRRPYLDLVLDSGGRTTQKLHKLSIKECEQLLERYRRYGLIGSRRAIQYPKTFARQLLDDPIAVAVCRIMNNFRPLDAIIESLWQASPPDDRLPYLCVALTGYCYTVGLRYSLLQAITGPGKPIRHLFDVDKPLGLTESPIDDDYVVAVNSIVAERVLFRAVRKDPATLFSAFEVTAKVLAPHVNLKAIRLRSPEARLAGRLLDYDKIVGPLLGDSTESFFLAIQTQWEWDSRYWEQRALLAVETDLQAALQHARYAVAINLHPFPLTTLGKVLLMEMESTPSRLDTAYSEAFEKLTQAIELEFRRSRITVHPFLTLLAGTARYRELGGKLSEKQRQAIDHYLGEAQVRFGYNPLVAKTLLGWKIT